MTRTTVPEFPARQPSQGVWSAALFCGPLLGIGMPSYGMFIDSHGELLHPDAVELESVFETLNPAEAQLIRSRLEAAGLDAEVDPEIDPLCVGGFSLPSGGIQIKVPADQASEARAILDAGEKAEG